MVQYPKQFTGPPRDISNSCSAALRDANGGGLNNTTGVAFHGTP